MSFALPSNGNLRLKNQTLNVFISVIIKILGFDRYI